MKEISGIGKKSRQQLARVLAGTSGIIQSRDVAEILELSERAARNLLCRWAAHGWLQRVRMGVYIPVPLDSETSQLPIEDPWIVAERLFSPCYIGGWSAAEYWELTDQIFHTLFVVTGKRFASRIQKVGGVEFRLKIIRPEFIYGTKAVWRGDVKVNVSDPSRTVIDILNDPLMAGGIISAIDFVEAYLHSDHLNADLLIDYAERRRNRVVFKRLGLLAERIRPDQKELIDACRSRIRPRYSQLDPQQSGTLKNISWRLYIPEHIRGFDRDK